MSFEFVENEVKEVGPGVWIRVAIDNIAWCDLGEGVNGGAAVIDALEDPEQADVVRGLIKETTGRDLKYVVTTHWDADHIACNPQWKREGAIVIAHQTNADSAGDWEGHPDISYDDCATLRGPVEQIEMQWVGGTHTPWDTILYFPRAKVLHIADLFGWGLIPCQPTPQKVARLRDVLNRVLTYDANAVICGHGPVTNLDCIRRFVEYFERMLQDVPPLLKAGKTVEEIEAQIPPPADMENWWRFTAWKHKKNIELIQEFYVA
jgi:glyoxylase-like metal-dependent hydrolase (beta-lactamase superfamily II)